MSSATAFIIGGLIGGALVYVGALDPMFDAITELLSSLGV